MEVRRDATPIRPLTGGTSHSVLNTWVHVRRGKLPDRMPSTRSPPSLPVTADRREIDGALSARRGPRGRAIGEIAVTTIRYSSSTVPVRLAAVIQACGSLQASTPFIEI